MNFWGNIIINDNNMLGVLFRDLPYDILYEISLNFSLIELSRFFKLLHSVDAKYLINSLSFWIHYLKHHNIYDIEQIDTYKIIESLAQRLVLKYEEYIHVSPNSSTYLVYDLHIRIMLLPNIMTFVNNMISRVKIRRDLGSLLHIKTSMNHNEFKELIIHRLSSNPPINYIESPIISMLGHVRNFLYNFMVAAVRRIDPENDTPECVGMADMTDVLIQVGWYSIDPYYSDDDKWKNEPIILTYDTIHNALCNYLIPRNRDWSSAFFDD